MTTLRLKAEWANGILKPLEPLDLREGAILTLIIEQDEAKDLESHNVLETIDRLREPIGQDDWDGIPTDGAKNYRHYRYGHPRVE
ncbi:MAG: antitoxin family protein [Chloroflexota bacterium]|nr:antitoxin family protein [Chloroflexota bacterium]